MPIIKIEGLDPPKVEKVYAQKQKYYMQKVMRAIAVVLVCSLFPGLALAATPMPKVYSGTITKIFGSQLVFSSSSGINYTADIAGAVLMRRNGAPMVFSEFLLGDKIEVQGRLWPDNSISASSIRDLTLYPHTGTFSGKISLLNPTTSSFTLQGSQPSFRTVHANTLTTYKVNGSNSTFENLQLGMTVQVKGVWERQNADVTATAIDAKLRLVSIELIGQLAMTGDTSFTVISNNAIYGVDVSKAKLQSKNGNTFSQGGFIAGHTVRVTGKHVPGSVQITASVVKDLSVSK